MLSRRSALSLACLNAVQVNLCSSGISAHIKKGLVTSVNEQPYVGKAALTYHVLLLIRQDDLKKHCCCQLAY